MKKIVLLIALGFSSMGVMAQQACNGTAGTGAVDIGAATGNNFVRVPFRAQCSQDTLVTVAENQVALWGGAGSLKGARTFSGSTNGGAILPGDTCPTTGCTQAEVTTAVTTASGLGSSS